MDVVSAHMAADLLRTSSLSVFGFVAIAALVTVARARSYWRAFGLAFQVLHLPVSCKLPSANACLHFGVT